MIHLFSNRFSTKKSALTYFSKTKSKLQREKFFPFKKDQYKKGTLPILLIVQSDSPDFIAAGMTLKEITNCHLLILKKHTNKTESKVNQYISKQMIRGVIGLEFSEVNQYAYMQNDHFHPLVNSIANACGLTNFESYICDTEDYCLKDALPSIKFSINSKNNFPSDLFTIILSLMNILPTQVENCKNDWHTIEPVIDKKVGSIVPWNRVELSKDTMEELKLMEHDYLVLFNPSNGFFQKCVVYERKRADLERGQIVLAKSVKKQFLNEEYTGKLSIQQAARFEFTSIQTQRASLVQENCVIVSENTFKQLQRLQSPFLELVNPYTGTSFDFNIHNVQVDEDITDNEIKLNYIQRQFLEYEQLPELLPTYKSLIHKKKTNSQECILADVEQELLENSYKNGKSLDKLEFTQSLKMKGLLNKVGYRTTYIYPVNHYYKVEEKKDWKEKVRDTILNVFIRDKAIDLKVIRPYTSDETSSIIRLTKSTMTLLGIEEADSVLLQYRNKTARVQVLEMSDLELVKETNVMNTSSTMNICVAVPSSIREQLGITNIGKVCTVRRDMMFLLQKNWNIQFVPIMAVLFTVLTLDIFTTWMQILLITVFIPFSMYVTLSRVRYSISTKKGSSS
ncbi:hypothetical protein [Bacillus alkalisoli]|uniref:hypothetical protein n=1 Tax=Bacillus alkalisoli TaxID=2011008 RepID=UPI000C250B50|nr:hypothetical protein [Bacillus alkalisoli]